MIFKPLTDTIGNFAEIAGDFAGIGRVGPDIDSRVAESRELLIETDAVLARIDLVHGVRYGVENIRREGLVDPAVENEFSTV